MSNLEYSVVVQELQSLIGTHLENIYSIGNLVRLKIGGKDIIIEPGIRAHTTKYIEKDEEPSSFVTTLRQYIRNARLRALYLHNNDRIVVFDFGEMQLVCEMFAKGNVILVENGKTTAALKQEEWSDRVIARNKPYSFPKSNVKTSVRDALASAPAKYVVVALLQLPLGKEYVLELLRRLTIDEKKGVRELTEKEIVALEAGYETILKNARPYASYAQDVVNAVSLVKTDPNAKEFPTLNEALDEYYFHNKEVRNEKLEKLKKRLEEQEKRLLLLKGEELLHKQTGDYIYEQYEKIESLLGSVRGLPIGNIENKFPHLKVRKKEKEIEVDI